VITPCKLVYPYFDSPNMLEFQVENWNRFDDELRSEVEIIVVDDHSPKSAVPILEKCTVPVRAYRVAQRFPWNMHQCRNIGAKEACTASENMWLFMSDIDTVLPPEMAYKMLTKTLNPPKYYTMELTYQTDPMLRVPTKNTFLVKHAAFWQVNGYDLDLTPIGGGGYGGARQFRKQLKEVVSREHLDDVVVVEYSRRARDAFGNKLEGPGSRLIDDASAPRDDRKDWHKKFKEALARKQQSGDRRSVNPIRVDYTRVL
jgi:glycosyl transferase family 2